MPESNAAATYDRRSELRSFRELIKKKQCEGIFSFLLIQWSLIYSGSLARCFQSTLLKY